VSDDGLDWIEHLEELRQRLIVILVATAILAAGSYFFVEHLLAFLLKPLSAHQEQLYFMAPYEAFMVRLKIALAAGVVVGSPLILTQISASNYNIIQSFDHINLS